MSVEPRQALYAHLKANPAVQAAVGDRVYQRRVPDGAVKPLIVIYPTISRTPNRILEGVSHRRARLQVTAMSEAQPEAERAASAVITAVEGFSGLMAGALDVILATVDNDRQVDQDGVNEIHHHVDVMITYREG
jgi:DNA integrity scanning protein DisA with diadenylate cyclase activity